jgi:hypothetical protein
MVGELVEPLEYVKESYLRKKNPCQSIFATKYSGGNINIGIFIHLQPGHSAEMDMAMTKNYVKKHTVNIQLMKPVDNIRPYMKHIEFKDEFPDLSSYNAIIFGGSI